MVKYIEIDRAIETALLLLEEGEDEQTLAYNAALVTFVKNMENQPTADVAEVAVNIVHNVIGEHIHGEWNEEEQAQVFSAWDWELLAINKEICNKIRDEVTE